MTIDLNALEALLQKATPEPWAIEAIPMHTIKVEQRLASRGEDIDRGYLDLWSHDADLIVALRNAAPALLVELRQLREALESVPLNVHTHDCKMRVGEDLRSCSCHCAIVRAIQEQE